MFVATVILGCLLLLSVIAEIKHLYRLAFCCEILLPSVSAYPKFLSLLFGC